MSGLFRILFAIVALLTLVAGEMQLVQLNYFSKPLIMLSLLGYYFSTTKPGERSVVAIGALIFSWVGDVMLMFEGEHYFMFGLGAFLVSHLFYIGAYRQHKTETGEGFYGVQKVRYAFPIILAGTGLLTILYPALGGLKIPVAAYALVLVVMVLAALFRFGFTSSTSFWLVFIGALLFMISDSSLAINKFLNPIPHSGLLVMTTYMGAQLLIVEGLLKHKAT
jgi:uncharacterized membrane protein YhhN